LPFFAAGLIHRRTIFAPIFAGRTVAAAFAFKLIAHIDNNRRKRNNDNNNAYGNN
jgi:hypothetical protein